jgi:hypothetical protein
MKSLIVIAAIAALGASATIASAQSGMATAPMDSSTGPTVLAPSPSDTRQIDQSIANAPSSASPPTAEIHPNSENWRGSSGMNADPDNPSGAPGPSTGTGTSRGR